MSSRGSASKPAYVRVLLCLVLIVGILHLAKAFIVPLALAILITFVLSPLVRGIQSWGLGRAPAVLVTVLLSFILVGAVAWGVGSQVNKLARDLPDQKEKIQKKIAVLRGSGQGVFGRLFEMVREISEAPGETGAIGDQVNSNTKTPPAEKQVIVARREEPSPFERVAQTVSPVLEPLATAGLVVILVVFMLVKREDLRNRLIVLLGHGQLTEATLVLVDATQRLSSYLLTQLLVNVGFGTLFGVWLLVIGVPYAFLWGFLTAVLRFIPYIGTWIAAAFPLVLSFAISDGWWQPVEALVFFAVLDLATANVLEPLLFGHSTGVTPIALLIAAAFWTWIWGPIGLVLSTPLTVCMVVLGQHVPRLKFFTLLLGEQPALAPHSSYYQRLVAKDQAEAAQVLVEYVRTGDPDKVYDDVLLPALALARRDRRDAGLSAETEEFVLQAIRDDLAEREKEPTAEREKEPTAPPILDGKADAPVTTATGASRPPVLILGCPAHHEAEELSLHMLALLLKPDGCRLETMSTKALPAEFEAMIVREKPELVFVAILPPGGLVQARYLCKRLRARFADLPIIVGYWGTAGDFDRMLLRLRSAGASYVTTSLHQSRIQVLALVNPAALALPPAPAASLQPAGGAHS